MPTYPYVSGSGPVLKAFEQLRKGFPAKVDAGYLQRFKIAPSNESYVIGILRFLGLVDDEGNKREDRVDFFFGNDEKFRSGLDAVLRDAYSQLVGEMGEDAFTTPRDDLGHWFRGADKTSELIGKRQASTFLAMASLAGHGAPPASVPTSPRVRSAGASSSASRGKQQAKAPVDLAPEPSSSPAAVQKQSDVGLTVRIEVNLPAGGDASTYDAIFASIKRHLIP